MLARLFRSPLIPSEFPPIKNLKSFYDESTHGNCPFVCEMVNRTVNLEKQKHKMLFVPDIHFMGAKKNDPTILELVEKVKHLNKSPFFSNEHDLLGTVSNYCIEYINSGKMNLVGGQYIGVKTKDRKTILLENLMEEDYLDLASDAVGIYIPEDEILLRPKYQWFSVLNSQQILETNIFIAKHIKASMVDAMSHYNTTEIKSIISI